MAKVAKRYNIAEAKARLSDLVREASVGYEVIIARDNRPVAKLVPIATTRARTPGSAVGLVTIAEDFDAALDDFTDEAG
jgi:prevent-host-death family protein